MSYDLIVIGGGPAGYTSAEKAGRVGLKTLLVEKRAIGGVCLHEGCIPSKILLHSAKLYDYAKTSQKYGVTVGEVSFDHGRVLERKDKVIKILAAGIKNRLVKSNVTLLEGTAQILGQHEAEFQIGVNEQVYEAKQLLIATGAMPVIPPIPGATEGLATGMVLTNRQILELTTIPTSLVIIGGGAIGLEMASYFNSVGSKVTVIEMMDQVGGNIDGDIAAILLKNYQKKGVEFKVNSQVTAIAAGQVTYQTSGETGTLVAEKVLLSIGRKPLVEGLGLNNIGVEVVQGRVRTDEYGRTNIPGVYAAGDVNGRSMLAHTAYREAEVCISSILLREDGPTNEGVRYDAIPAVIYTNPEVAGVGETEFSARQKGIDYELANISMRYSGRYLAENEGGDGICKILIAKESRVLIGVHLIANYASEIIYGAGMMLGQRMSIHDLQEIVFPHPSIAEIIHESIGEFADE